MTEEITKKTPRLPHLWEVLVPVVFMMALIIVCTVSWGVEPHIPILLSCVVAGIMAFRCGYSWQTIITGVLESIGRATEAMLIVMIVGMVIGSWIQAGTMSTLVYFGLELLTPQAFLLVGVFVVAFIGWVSGSSWTASGTVGVAMMGIAAGLGVNPAIAAGMVISGAYMGDKWSPLSDSTNLAAATAETPLFEHVKSMVITTLPSFIIAMILYGIVGFNIDTSNYDPHNVAAIQDALASEAHIAAWLVLPVLVIILGAIFKIPAIPTLLAASVVAGIIAMIAQGATIGEVLNAFHYGHEADTGNETADAILNRGGVDGMMWTISLIMFALGFGGILEKCRFVEAALSKLITKIKRVGGLVMVTVLTGIASDFILTDQYISILIPGRMYAKYFDEKGLKRNFLSRTLEDGATLWSPMCPWNGCGAYQAATLGVPTWEYFPFAFMNLVNPVVSIIFAYAGIGIRFNDESKNKKWWGINTKANEIAAENAEKFKAEEAAKAEA